MTVPFRWNIERECEVAGLLRDVSSAGLGGWFDELRACAARVLALSRDGDLVFVGRSPENLHDYLSGVLRGTSWKRRLTLLNISLRGVSADSLHPTRVEVAKEHFRALALNPAALICRSRPIVLVDLVYYGWTFESLSDFLLSWAADDHQDVPAVRKKLRFLAITRRSSRGVNAERWTDDAKWLADFPKGAAQSTPVEREIWSNWGDTQAKTVHSNPPALWGSVELQTPPYCEGNLEALSFAVRLYKKGRARGEQLSFSRLLAAQPEMRFAWLRRLVGEMRRTSRVRGVPPW